MKTKINFLFVALFLLEIATAQTLVEHQQDWIDQPANISIGNFDSFINASIANEGMAKINVIDPSTQSVGYSPTDSWPQGTWLHGYYERGDFWTYWEAGCTHTNNGFPSSHPLFRINSKMLRALIHANHTFPLETWVADNILTIKEGMDYMISQQQSPVPYDPVEDGGFTWWFTRPGSATPNTNEDRNSNFTHAYETSHALRTMCEAYMYFQDNGISYSNMSGLYQAIVKAADNLERKNETACDLENSNFKGLALWGLTAAYKVAYHQGDLANSDKYFNKARAISNLLMGLQTTDGGIQDGMWLTGGCDSDGCGAPEEDPCEVDPYLTDNNTIYHDTYIHYHCIILRGLVEMMDITPDAEVAWKTSLIANIKKAVNHIINYRVAYYDNPALGISRGMVRSTWTAIDGGTTCGIWTFYYYEEVMEPIAMLALYSEYQSYFSCEERKILRNLLLTLGVQAHSTYYLENFVSYAYYADYFLAYENHQRIFPSFENNNFINPYTAITQYDNHTVPVGGETIEHPNEIDFTNLNVPANTSLTVASGVRIRCSPSSQALSGSNFHAYISSPECPGAQQLKTAGSGQTGRMVGSFSTTYLASAPVPDTLQQISNVNTLTSQSISKSLNQQSLHENSPDYNHFDIALNFQYNPVPAMSIFPNPGRGKFFISVNNSPGEMTIFIEDIFGRHIVVRSVKSPVNFIDISDNPSGIYFVKVISGEEVFVQKLILQ